jgi:hypothetical protein
MGPDRSSVANYGELGELRSVWRKVKDVYSIKVHNLAIDKGPGMREMQGNWRYRIHTAKDGFDFGYSVLHIFEQPLVEIPDVQGPAYYWRQYGSARLK